MFFEHDDALRKAIKILGSQAALARALKITRFQVNHWLNRDRFIPFEYAVAIETLTHGRVNRYELAPYAQKLMHSCERFIRKECLSA